MAISACLFGEAVRYDGQAKKINTLSILKENLNLKSICPEVGAGLNTPRPPIELVQTNDEIIALGRDDRTLNPTQALKQFAEKSFQTLHSDIIGYIFKSRSPSCGLNSTPIRVNQETLGPCDNSTTKIGSGLQADYFSKNAPHIIFIEDSELKTQESCLHYIFTCRLALDINTAISNSEHEKLFQHYQPFLYSLPKTIQQRLIKGGPQRS